MQLSALDATAQADLVARGEVSPRELVDASIARIERDNPELGAVIMPMFDEARGTTPADGPFRGVPILIKDILATVQGMPQVMGIRPLRERPWRAPVDSHLVAALRRAGFIIVGKTNTSELGIVPTAEPPAWPPSRNPYDRTRTTGGSSGGSAAAVASGMVAIAHANDGGGSIRIPASCCGLFGLKPSRGRVSLAPWYGENHGGLVQEHVVARSVRDSAAVLDLLAGLQPGDPYTAPTPARPFAQEVGAPTGRLRIGFATRHPHVDAEGGGGMIESHADCRAAVEHAANLLASLGHTVEHAEIPTLSDPEWVSRFLTIWVTGTAADLDEVAELLGRPLTEADVEPLTWGLASLGRLIGAHAYINAWRWLHAATRRIATFFDTYDLWLTPTVTEPPVPLDTFKSPPDDPLAGIFRAADFAPFTAVFNATGQPACSIPLYRNATGLPIGIQLAAAYGREDLLLRVASQLEAAQPFVHAATR
jgi:amidase